MRPRRRKKQDRKRVKLLWKRRFFLTALIGVICILLFLPLQIKIWGMKEELFRLRREEQAVLKRQEELRENLKYYASDAFVEEAARRELGLVKPGETLIVPAVPGKVQPPPENPGKNPYAD